LPDGASGVDEAETNVMPVGIRSRTVTPVAAFGPELRTVTLNVTLEPTLGDALLAVFVNDKSAETTAIVTLAWSSSVGMLLPGVELGSG
jgi:hypothetical protein